MNRDNEQSRSTFVSLDINEEVTDTKTTVDSLMISESFSKSFEMLKLQLSRMIGDLNLLNGETGKLGTFQDTHSLREEINRKLIKISKEFDSTGKELKTLSSQAFTIGERNRLKQLALDYSGLLDKIEETDKFVIKECKAFVKDAKVKFKEEERDGGGGVKEENVPLIANAKAMMNPGLKEEIEYNERLIDEREQEIQNISRASNLITELFQQIGLVTTEQQDLIDNIEANADYTRDTTRKAVRHLDRTHRQHQQKTSRICFYFIFIVIAAVFVLTVLASIL